MIDTGRAIAHRLVRMFSFQSDTVLDPFCGTGTTMLAAIKTGRSSIGVEIDAENSPRRHQDTKKNIWNLRNLWLSPEQMPLRRLERETRSLFSGVEVFFTTAAEMEPYPTHRPERIAAVSDAPRRKRTRRN